MNTNRTTGGSLYPEGKVCNSIIHPLHVDTYIRMYIYTCAQKEQCNRKCHSPRCVVRYVIIWLPKKYSRRYSQKTALPVTHCICGSLVMTRMGYHPVCVLIPYHRHVIVMLVTTAVVNLLQSDSLMHWLMSLHTSPPPSFPHTHMHTCTPCT